MIDLTIKTLDSRNHTFSVPDDITVKQLKELIADSVNVPADSQRLIYCGRVLQDDKNLAEYDVNGKVIHLVQRPPPSHFTGSDGGANRSGSQPHSRGTSTSRRQHLFQSSSGRLDGGNAMYLGAMAFPTDLMESQGLTMPQPRQYLSQSRLAVARQMLRHASNTLQHLENPDLTNQQDSPMDSSPDGTTSGDAALPGSIAVAAQVATAAAIAAAVSAAQGSSVHIPSMHAQDEGAGRSSFMRVDDVEVSGSDLGVAGEERDTSPASETATRESPPADTTEPGPTAGREEAAASVQQQATSQPASGASENQSSQAENGSGNGRSRYPRTTAMAQLLDTLAEVNQRLQPHLENFHQVMRDDPVLESPDATQGLFVQVSEVMHSMAHAYHALSDIMCDFSQPPPRYLRCRPVLIQHSAVVQTGIPIQAQINVTTNPINQQSAGNQTPGSRQRGTPESESQTQTEESGRSAQAQTAATGGSTGSTTTTTGSTNSGQQTPTGVAFTLPSPGNGSFSNVWAGGSRYRYMRPNATNMPYFSTREANQAESNSQPDNRQTSQGSPPVNLGPSAGNFEFFMDVGPAGAITIDSVEATVVTNANTNTSEVSEFIQNLMQALAGQMMDGATGGTGGGRQQGGSANTATSNASSAASTTGSQPSAAQNATTANSQARGNTATHPTTSTQTRSTARPHVHLTPAVQGLGASSFDPFLPCNSHHIRGSRRRTSQAQHGNITMTASTASATSQPSAPPSTQQQQTPVTRSCQVTLGSTGSNSNNAQAQNGGAATATNNSANSQGSQPRQAGSVFTRLPTTEALLNLSLLMLGNMTRGPNATVNVNSSSSQPRMDGEFITVTSQNLPQNLAQFLPSLIFGGGAGGVGSAPASDSFQQVPLPTGFPVTMLSQLLSGLTGGAAQPSSTLAAFLQTLPDFSYTEGESIFLDIFMTLAQSLTFVDIMNLGFGNYSCLVRTRPQLRRFVTERLLQNEPLSQASASRATDLINQELRPHLEIVQQETNLREDIDLIATINQLNHHQLPTIMFAIMEGENNLFHQVLLFESYNYVRYLCAIIQYCCVDGIDGMENIIRGFVRQMTTGVPEQMQAWTVASSIVNLRSYLWSIRSMNDEIQRYIVYRRPDVQHTTSTAEPVVQPSAEPMDMEPSAPASTEDVVAPASSRLKPQAQVLPRPRTPPPSSPSRTTVQTATAQLTAATATAQLASATAPPVTSTTATATAAAPTSPAEVPYVPIGEPMPDVILGSEEWHGALPSDWVPIITRDTLRQRRQGSQPPFSDAYLSGMPSKRRKLITATKPQGSLSQVISENMQTAVGTAGVVSPGVEVGVVAQGAGADPTLRLAYRDEVRASVRQSLRSHPDYAPEKYPNAAKYFDAK